MSSKNISLVSSPKDIEKYIMEEEDSETLAEIIKLFNLSLKKRDLIRSSKLSEIQDKVVEQIATRVEERPDNFSNEDLLKYYKTIQSSLVDTSTSSKEISVPSIQLNQQINVNTEEFDRDSRRRIINTVNQILDLVKDTSVTVEDAVALSDEDMRVIDE